MTDKETSLKRRLETIENEKRRRAQQLAQPLTRTEQGPHARRRFVFVLGGERFALAVERIDGLHFLPTLTKLPGAPPHISGVVNIAGRAVIVVELGLLFQSAEPADMEERRLIVVKQHNQRLAFVIDEALGIQDFEVVEEAKDWGQSHSWLRARHIEGIADGPTLLLNINEVLSDSRIRVDQRPSEERGK